MAWTAPILDASFRGVKFDCTTTGDSGARDTASHEYPYLDGADVEDLGGKSRKISMKAVFFGNDYVKRLNRFLKALDQSGPGELVHPVFGSIRSAQLLSYEVSHAADDPDYCTVSLQFTEATAANPFFWLQLPGQLANMLGQLSGLCREAGFGVFASALDSIGKTITDNLPRINALGGVLNGTLNALRQICPSFVASKVDLILYPRAFAADVSAVFSAVAGVYAFSSMARSSDWNTLTGELENVAQLPEQVAAGTADLSNGAWSARVESAPIPAQAEDVGRVSALLQLSKAAVLAETAGRILVMEADEPTLSPHEVERIANDAREAVQEAIDLHRAWYPLETSRPVVESLKETALGVLRAANAVIEARPPLISHTLKAPCNLHLLAFELYGDYSRSNELARLNPQLRNPNDLQSGEVLHVYAN